jgi:hypothetical protein
MCIFAISSFQCQDQPTWPIHFCTVEPVSGGWGEVRARRAEELLELFRMLGAFFCYCYIGDFVIEVVLGFCIRVILDLFLGWLSSMF